MAESNHENTILNHLNQHIQDLEQRLSYPKNNWKRQEDLTQQLSEAQKRLGAIAGRSPRRQSVRSQGFEGDRSRKPR